MLLVLHVNCVLMNHAGFKITNGCSCQRAHHPLSSLRIALHARRTHRFHREEAAYCFEQAVAADPDAALPHWGLAIAHGPDCELHSATDNFIIIINYYCLYLM